MRILVIALVLLATSAAHAQTPTETVRSQVDRALETAAKAPRTAEGTEQRRVEIRRVSEALFDFREMSQRTLGRHWSGRTSEERDQFVRLFSDLMSRAYLGKMDLYSGEPMSYVGERSDGNAASVQARVITKKGSEVPIEYRLHRLGDRWAVYDVVIEGVSLLSTYRSQFDRIIRTESFAELLKRMRQKEQEAASAGPAR